MSEQAGTPIQRYTQTSGAVVATFDSFTGAPSGEWIKASDYDALERDRADLLAALRELDACERAEVTALANRGNYSAEDFAELMFYLSERRAPAWTAARALLAKLGGGSHG